MISQKKIIIRSLVLLAALLASGLIAQDIPGNADAENANSAIFTLFNQTGNNLTSNFITGICEDSLGRLIIGTGKGMNFYNGYEFYTVPVPGDSNNIMTTTISGMVMDKKGFIYFGSMLNGLFRYDPARNSLKNIHIYHNPNFHKDDLMARFSQRIQSLLYLPEDRIIFSYFHQNGFFTLDTRTGHITESAVGNERVINRIVQGSGDDILIICTDGSVFRYDFTTNAISSVDLPELCNNCRISTAFVDSRKNIWFATANNGLFKVNGNTVESFPMDSDKNRDIYYRSFLEDKFHNIWIGTSEGLYRYNSDESWTHFQYQGNTGFSLPVENIWYLFIDSSNYLWIGTDHGLVRMITATNLAGYKVFHADKTHQTDVTCMTQLNTNRFLLGTNNSGLQIFDNRDVSIKPLMWANMDSVLKTGNVRNCVQSNNYIYTVFAHHGLFEAMLNDSEDLTFHPLSVPGYSGESKLPMFHNLGVDSRGNVWISLLRENSILYFDPVHRQFHNVSFPDSMRQKNSFIVQKFFNDRDGNLWLGTRNGLYEWNGREIIGHHSQMEDGRNFITGIHQDSHGDIWYSDQMEGLNTIGDDGAVKTIIANHKKEWIFDFELDENDNVIWYTQQKHGLGRYDMDLGTTSFLGLNQGLAGNNYYSLFFIDPYEILLFGNQGLSAYNTLTDQILNYTNDQGFRFSITVGATFVKKNDNLLFGGRDNIFSISPEDLVPEIPHKSVLFKSVFINNREVFSGSRNEHHQQYFSKNLNSKPVINMWSEDKIISFDYYYIDLVNADQTKYAIKLLNVDNDWQYVGHKRSASYAFLPPGKYELQVIAASAKGLWTPETASLQIWVHPSFWQTRTPKVLGILLLLLLLSLFWSLRIRRIRERNAFLQEHNKSLEEEIEKRKTIEKEIRKLSTAVEQSLESIVITDLSGTVEYVNPAFLITAGIKLDDCLGWPIGKLLGNDYSDKTMAFKIYKASISADKNTIFEYQRADGNVLRLIETVSPISIEEKVEKVLYIFHDITQITKMEKELELSRKMRAVGTLASGIAHDLNNILASIRLNADLIARATDFSEESQLDMNELVDSTNKAKNIVRQIVEFSRQEPASLLPINLSEVLEENSRVLQSIARDGIDFQLSVEKEMYILGDKTKLFQIMINLVTNAVDAIEGKGVIQIILKQQLLRDEDLAAYPGKQPGQYCVLSVQDSGCGISREHINQIFDPFFTTKQVGKGTGLGLSIIRSIIENFKGIITVDSNPGQGTVFTLIFPHYLSERKS